VSWVDEVDAILVLIQGFGLYSLLSFLMFHLRFTVCVFVLCIVCCVFINDIARFK